MSYNTSVYFEEKEDKSQKKAKTSSTSDTSDILSTSTSESTDSVSVDMLFLDGVDMRSPRTKEREEKEKRWDMEEEEENKKYQEQLLCWEIEKQISNIMLKTTFNNIKIVVENDFTESEKVEYKEEIEKFNKMETWEFKGIMNDFKTYQNPIEIQTMSNLK